MNSLVFSYVVMRFTVQCELLSGEDLFLNLYTKKLIAVAELKVCKGCKEDSSK